jgi:molecular chaperone GrpE (heat shock protein)
MSHNYKPNQVKPVQSALFEMPPAAVHPKERERVEQLIAGAKSGLAVDFAKDVHKRRQSAASEALLLDAYGARILSLLERSLDREAKALMELVVRALEEGYRLSLGYLDDLLFQFQVQPIECEGRQFDPRRMNAVDVEETDQAEEGTVVSVYRTGYEWNGELFRPAQVRVARRPVG